MKAMVLDKPGERLRLADLPMPEPRAGQVLVQVRACAVCRTDLHVVDGELTEPKLPIVPGHEIVGEVVRAGPGVDRFRAGERVGIPWLGWTCGSCRYLRERAGEPVRSRALHRLSDRRRLRRIHCRRCPLLLSAARRLRRRRGGAALVCRADRLSLAAHGRRCRAPRHLRLRRRRPHRRPGGPAPGPAGLRLHPRGRPRGAGVRARPRRGLGRQLRRAAARGARRRDHLRPGRSADPGGARGRCARAASWSPAAST